MRRLIIFFLLVVGLFLPSDITHAASPGGATKCSGTVIDLGVEKKLLPFGELMRPGSCGVKPTKIIVHTTEGITGADALWDYFADSPEGRYASTQFTVGKDGKALQMLETLSDKVEIGWAVANYNDDSISIEVGHTGDYNSKSEAPAAQYQSLIDLIRKLMGAYNIPVGDIEYTTVNSSNAADSGSIKKSSIGIFGHYQLSPDDRQDPGQGFLRDVRADLKALGPASGSGTLTGGGSGSASSTSCVITKVGDPTESPPPLPANCSTSTSNASGSGSFTGSGKFTYYCQGDPRWANSCGLGDAGCGPTSLAMIMATFGVQTTPPQVDSVFQSSGWRGGCSAGSDIYSAINSSWFKNQGFTVGPNLISGDKPDLAQIQTYLSQGYIIILNAFNYPCKGCVNQFTPVGHILVVDGVDVAGNRMHTRDPNNCSWATGQENADPSLAWTDFKIPVSQGGGAGSSYNAAYPIKR